MRLVKDCGVTLSTYPRRACLKLCLPTMVIEFRRLQVRYPPWSAGIFFSLLSVDTDLKQHHKQHFYFSKIITSTLIISTSASSKLADNLQ